MPPATTHRHLLPAKQRPCLSSLCIHPRMNHDDVRCPGYQTSPIEQPPQRRSKFAAQRAQLTSTVSFSSCLVLFCLASSPTCAMIHTHHREEDRKCPSLYSSKLASHTVVSHTTSSSPRPTHGPIRHFWDDALYDHRNKRKSRSHARQIVSRTQYYNESSGVSPACCSRPRPYRLPDVVPPAAGLCAC